MTGMQGFLSALFFGLNIALSIGLMSLRDSCSQSEAIAVSLASNPTVKKLLTFYLDQSSANYFEPNEENVVLSTLLINETHIVDNIVTPINQTITQYLGQMNALTQKEISDVIATLTKSTGLILQLMGSYSSVGSLLYLLSVPVAQFNYGSTKSYLCCDVPGLIYNMYIGSTVLGWLCLVLLWIGAYFLWRMDYIAESKACCNCDCYKPINPCASEPNKGDPYNVPDEEMAPPEQMTMNSKGMITG